MRGSFPIRRFRSLPRPVLWLVAAFALFQFGVGHFVHAAAHTAAHATADPCAPCAPEPEGDECGFAKAMVLLAAPDAADPLALPPPLPAPLVRPAPSENPTARAVIAAHGRSPPVPA